MHQLICLMIIWGSACYAQVGPGKSSSQRKANSPLQAKVAVENKPLLKIDSVLMVVGGDSVTKGEFLSIFRKNNIRDTANQEKAIAEYLDLFINFKLKVKAAKDMGKDTSKAFINELKGYRKQLAQPYLTDKELNDKLIDEAYQRMKKEIRVSHILIGVKEDAIPKDTLAAFTKIMDLRKRLLKGEDFGKLAKEYSEDPSAKQNEGDLGYFTSMMMVYPFETVAYNTPVGQVSMPVRTKYGYHLIKGVDVRDARGQVHVAHIMVDVKENVADSIVARARKKAEELYAKVTSGEDFAKLASAYSDDRTSGKNGGELPWFGTNRMVLEFENAAFDIKNIGEISKPIRSPFGFHIIKLLDKKGIPSFDEVKGELKQKILRSKDSRSMIGRNAAIARIKKDYNFREENKSLDEMISKMDTSFLSGRWSMEKLDGPNKNLFQIGKESFGTKDFAKFLSENQSVQSKEASIELLVRKSYNTFRDNKIIEYEDAHLEEKYPDFRMLMQEYHDGILLFDITDQLVWSKALKDSSGLANFHEINKGKYMWGERLDAVIYKSKDVKTAKSVRKLVMKRKKKGYSTDEIKRKINVKSELNLQTEEGFFSRGDNETIDKISWAEGISPDQVSNDGSVIFVEVRRVMAPQPKSLQEAKGIITSDYQNFLEKEWINELRSKYKVEVKQEVLQTIK